MKKSIKIQLLNILAQTIPVVLGIFLAVYINQNEQLKKEKLYVKSLIDKAKEVIVQDSTVLNNEIVEHLELSKLLYKSVDKERKTVHEVLLDFGSGINITPINVNYLQVLVNSEIEHIQINQSSEIFQILDLVKGKERYEGLLQSTIYEGINSDSDKIKLKLSMILNDYGALERRLAASQKKFLKQ